MGGHHAVFVEPAKTARGESLYVCPGSIHSTQLDREITRLHLFPQAYWILVQYRQVSKC